ncbi:MAG: NUDIX domain-containing protein [Planctomycetota bacterium]
MSDAITDILRFCPRCGAQAFHSDNGHRFACAACDFVFFFNIATGSGALVLDDAGKLLVGVRAKEPDRGTYDFPGGFVDAGEGAEQALVRELKEELNLDVSEVRYLCSFPNNYRYRGVPYRVCDVFYRAHVHDFSGIEAADDVADFAFVDPLTVAPEQFGFISARRALLRLREELA